MAIVLITMVILLWGWALGRWVETQDACIHCVPTGCIILGLEWYDCTAECHYHGLYRLNSHYLLDTVGLNE